jgi:hypothetical protein
VNRINRCIRVGFVCATMALGLVGLISTNAAGAQESSRVASCRVSQVRESLSLSAKSYAPGTPVKMTVSIYNLSSKSCGVAVGPTSPSLSIANAQGVVFWNNCYSDDQPGACAMFLTLHVLKPKTSYRFSRAWNQRGGPKLAFVARGTYEVTARLSGLTSPQKIEFVLMA